MPRHAAQNALSAFCIDPADLWIPGTSMAVVRSWMQPNQGRATWSMSGSSSTSMSVSMPTDGGL